MKKRCSFLLVVAICLTLLVAGCDKQDSTDYDVLEYVTLGQYKGVEYEPASVEVTEEDVENEIQALLKEYAELLEVTDRAAQDGDVLNIDYVGRIDGEEFAGGSDEGIDLELGSGYFIPGFEDQLVGASVGDVVEVKLNFPDPYKNNPSLAGKPAEFTVTVNSISEQLLPEFNDAFVQEHTDSETVEDYRTVLIESLGTQKKESAALADQSSVWNTVLQNATVNQYSQAELDEYAEQYMNYYNSLAESLNTDLEGLAVNYMNTTVEEIEEESQKAAKSAIKERMVLRAIAKTENITVTDEEYAQGLKDYAEKAGAESAEVFEETYGKEMVELQLILDKTLDFLTQNAVAK